MTTNVRKNPDRSRYEIFVDGELAGIADYDVRGDSVVLPHTEIRADMRGRGVGEVLVRHALDDVRESARTVVPTCWFVAQYIDEHPEYADLLVA